MELNNMKPRTLSFYNFFIFLFFLFFLNSINVSSAVILPMKDMAKYLFKITLSTQQVCHEPKVQDFMYSNTRRQMRNNL